MMKNVIILSGNVLRSMVFYKALFDNEGLDGNWLWKDMSTYTNQYSTRVTNQGGSPWIQSSFLESNRIRGHLV